MKNLQRSFAYAITGIKLSLKQRNFKIQVLLAFLVVLAGFYFQITLPEWCILLVCIALVLSLEMVNTAIEHFVDLVSPDHHKTAGIVKDVAAGAVLFSSIISAIIGVIIFAKYILALL